MKKIIFCVAIAVALSAPHTLVFAQLLPGLPSLPGMPALNLPSNVTLGNLSVYGGWATNAGMTNYIVSTDDSVVMMPQAEWDYEYSSFYTATTLPVSMGDYGAALLSGSFALPSSSPARESHYSYTGGLLATRRWSADTYWATIEGIWAYPLSETFSALAGFRWECWQTSYKAPISERNPGIFGDIDLGWVTVNGYVPFVGLLATYRGLNVGAVGIPTMIGDVEYKETFHDLALAYLIANDTFTGGYFFEMFVDYALPLPGGLGPGVDADLSLFGKVSFLEAKATPTQNWWGGPGWTFQGSEEVDFRLHRNLFLLGAKATLKFNLAGILPF